MWVQRGQTIPGKWGNIKGKRPKKEEKVSSLFWGAELCHGQHISLTEVCTGSEGAELKMEKLKPETKYISSQEQPSSACSLYKQD